MGLGIRQHFSGLKQSPLAKLVLFEMLLVVLGLQLEGPQRPSLLVEQVGKAVGPVYHFGVVLAVGLSLAIGTRKVLLAAFLLQQKAAVSLGQLDLFPHHQCNHLFEQLRHLPEIVGAWAPSPETLHCLRPLPLPNTLLYHR